MTGLGSQAQAKANCPSHVVLALTPESTYLLIGPKLLRKSGTFMCA
jgi:hypothetical protein